MGDGEADANKGAVLSGLGSSDSAPQVRDAGAGAGAADSNANAGSDATAAAAVKQSETAMVVKVEEESKQGDQHTTPARNHGKAFIASTSKSRATRPGQALLDKGDSSVAATAVAKAATKYSQSLSLSTTASPANNSDSPTSSPGDIEETPLAEKLPTKSTGSSGGGDCMVQLPANEQEGSTADGKSMGGRSWSAPSMTNNNDAFAAVDAAGDSGLLSEQEDAEVGQGGKQESEAAGKLSSVVPGVPSHDDGRQSNSGGSVGAIDDGVVGDGPAADTTSAENEMAVATDKSGAERSAVSEAVHARRQELTRATRNGSGDGRRGEKSISSGSGDNDDDAVYVERKGETGSRATTVVGVKRSAPAEDEGERVREGWDREEMMQSKAKR